MSDPTFIIALDADNKIIARADSRRDLDRILAEKNHLRVVDIRWVDDGQLQAITSADATLSTPTLEPPASSAVKASRKKLKDVNPSLVDETPTP